MPDAPMGVGGVRGLPWLTRHAGSNAGTHFCACDGNANVWQLVSASTSTETARCEYGFFGEPLRAPGPPLSSRPSGSAPNASTRPLGWPFTSIVPSARPLGAGSAAPSPGKGEKKTLTHLWTMGPSNLGLQGRQ